MRANYRRFPEYFLPKVVTISFRVRKIRRKQVCRRKTRLRKFRLIGERQCTPKEQARYVNVRGSAQWKGVYRVGVDTGGAKYGDFSY